MAKKRRFQTTIRMGAAEFSLHTTDGRKELAMALPNVPERAGRELRAAVKANLSSVATELCAMHRIREKPVRVNGKFAKKPEAPAKVPHQHRRKPRPTGRNGYPQVEVRA